MSETNAAATSSVLSYEEVVAENQRLSALLANAHADIQNLIAQVRSLKSFVFGRKSEKLFNSAQEPLFSLPAGEELPETKATIPIPAHERTVRKGRKPLPENLPIERIEYEPEEKNCSCCGREMAAIGEEITEELEYIPAYFKRVQHAKIKRACSRCKDEVVQGVLPAGVPVIEKGRPGPGLLAFILISKYCDHLPLYRLEQIFARHGVEIPRQRMCDWIGMIAERFLLGIALALKRGILRSAYVRTDETELEVQTEEKDGKLHKGFLWGLLSVEREVYFEYVGSRSEKTAKALLGGIAGVVQSDFCPAYDGISEIAGIIRAGCWDHARRKFFDAKEAHWRECQKVLSHIGELYRIEREHKKCCEKERRGIDSSERLLLRQRKSRPVMEELKTYLDTLALSVLPKSPLGKALAYCLPEWAAFCVFLDNGLIELSNIAIEQQIRPIAVGRKNWLFAGSDRGAQWAAIMYSLFGSCKLIGVNPFDYMVDVLRRAPAMKNSEIETLTPRAWKAARDRAALPHTPVLQQPPASEHHGD